MAKTVTLCSSAATRKQCQQCQRHLQPETHNSHAPTTKQWQCSLAWPNDFRYNLRGSAGCPPTSSILTAEIELFTGATAAQDLLRGGAWVWPDSPFKWVPSVNFRLRAFPCAPTAITAQSSHANLEASECLMQLIIKACDKLFVQKQRTNEGRGRRERRAEVWHAYMNTYVCLYVWTCTHMQIVCMWREGWLLLRERERARGREPALYAHLLSLLPIVPCCCCFFGINKKLANIKITNREK